MWRLIYNVLIHLLLPFFVVISLTSKKIRTNLLERLCLSTTKDDITHGVWIHAASVGEAVIAENLINCLRPRMGNQFVVTTNTYYARDMLRARLGKEVKVYSLPFDLPYSIRRFMGKSTFSALILVETELWPNLIWIARSAHIPVIVVNGRISDKTIGRYRCFSFFLKHVLSSVDLVLAQSEEHAERYVSLGMNPSKVIATGNLKYYREIKSDLDIPTKEDIVTFGSVKEKELPLLIPVIKALLVAFPHLRIFIAPRELSLIGTIERQLPVEVASVRYSAIKTHDDEKARLVVVDTVGDLINIYGRSKVAFVGGSLAPYGGQNMLEPLFVGAPVIFGPYIENFRSVADNVLAGGAGYMIDDESALLSKLTLILKDEALRDKLISAGRIVAEAQKYAMKHTAQLIEEEIWKHSPSS